MKEKAPKDWIKLSDFEKITGLSVKTITAAIRRGTIPPACVDRVGTSATSPYYLHPQKAAQAWSENLNVSHPNSRIIYEKLTDYLNKGKPKKDKIKSKSASAEMSYADAQLKEQIAKAKIRELELQEKEGSLIKRDAVYNELFAFGQNLRNSLLAIPDRIADIIIAESNDRTKVVNEMYDTISSELQKLSDLNITTK